MLEQEHDNNTREEKLVLQRVRRVKTGKRHATMARPRGIVAQRKYEAAGLTLTAILYRPSKMSPPAKDWLAEYVIKGLPQDILGRAFGVDGMQALFLAAQGLRIKLESLNAPVSWLGGEQGSTGIHREIPWSYGLSFSKRAEKIVEKEAARFVRESAKGRQRQPKSKTRRVEK